MTNAGLLLWQLLLSHMPRVTGTKPALSAWEVSVTIRGLPADTLACGILARLTASDRELLSGLTSSGT
jgi:hypothetical protein